MSDSVKHSSLTLRIVFTEVPVRVAMFRSEMHFFSILISFWYCSLYDSMSFLYDEGCPIFMPSLRHYSIYCALPLFMRSLIVRRSIDAISRSIVHMRLATWLICQNWEFQVNSSLCTGSLCFHWVSESLWVLRECCGRGGWFRDIPLFAHSWNVRTQSFRLALFGFHVIPHHWSY